MTESFKRLCHIPLKLQHNRVYRAYLGGRLLDQWQGKKDQKDGNFPEEWVASTVEARNENKVQDEGLSKVELNDRSTFILRDVISSYPQGFLGEEHFKKYGENTAVLVKALDSCSRLIIQVHPDKTYARNILGSNFGKTEAWYIIGGRRINGEDPYVLLGFKPGVTRQMWEELFYKQDVDAMLDSLHRFTIKPGDVFLIEGGVPHAIGPGCFLMEIQEPTDYTMRLERVSPSGSRLSDEQMHQGAGFERMLDCFHYDAFTRDQILNKWYLKPSIVRENSNGIEVSLISPEVTPCFSMKSIRVDREFTTCNESVFSIAVIVSGKGVLVWDGGEMEVKQSDELFMPAGLSSVTWKADEMDKLEVVLCYPPR